MSSFDRFVRASYLTETKRLPKKSQMVKYSFNLLGNIAQGSRTKWSIVYNITFGKIYFKTYSHKKSKFIRLQKVDFSCKTPTLVYDLMNDLLNRQNNNAFSTCFAQVFNHIPEFIFLHNGGNRTPSFFSQRSY